MPTLHTRVGELEDRVQKIEAKVNTLEAWMKDEAELRDIDNKRLALLEDAKVIHDRIMERLSSAGAKSEG